MRLSTLCATVMMPLTLSCSRGEPTKQDRGRAPGSETDPASESRGAQAVASNSAVAAAEQHGTRLEGPRTDNEGRNFEGRLQLKVTGLREPLQIRYLSRGERGRLQLERAGSSGFDAIFAGDQVIVLDHSRRRYRAQELKQVPKKSEPSVDVDVQRTSDRIMVQGLACYPWQIRSGTQEVKACVRGLPGPFDTDKLETLSGLDVPAWVEKLIADHYLPITATVTENGRELYKVEMVQYSPDEVPESELTVPANYQKL